MTRNRFHTLFVSIAAAVLAGCGGGEEAAAPPVDAAAVPAADATLAASGAAGAPGAPAAASSGPVFNNAEGSNLPVGGRGFKKGVDDDLFKEKAALGDPDEPVAEATEPVSTVPALPANATPLPPAPAATPAVPAVPAPAPKPKKAVRYTGAVIKVDGNTHTVAKKSYFPDDTDQFKVTDIFANSVVISLTAGEFTDGSEGITLKKGKTVTLVNQNEGVKYQLTLVKVMSTESNTTFDFTESASEPTTVT